MTPRLRLRKVERGDLPLLVEWSNSKEAYGDFLTPECYELEKTAQDLKNGILWSEQNRLFIVDLKESEIPIGTIHYWIKSENKKLGVMAVKIALPAYRSSGFGTEAQKYLIKHLFERVRLTQVEMYTDVSNLSQQRCLIKLGFDLVESLQYEDAQVKRTGHLFKLSAERFTNTPIYHYVYE